MWGSAFNIPVVKSSLLVLVSLIKIMDRFEWLSTHWIFCTNLVCFFFLQFQMIPVAANDVAFSCHAVLLTAITLFQIAIYDVSTVKHYHFRVSRYWSSFLILKCLNSLWTQRGNQKVSKIAIGIVSGVWLTAAICFFIALHNHHWLWLISIFKYAFSAHCLHF